MGDYFDADSTSTDGNGSPTTGPSPPIKEDPFVLDFRNEAEEITAAFAPWYEQTTAVPTDSNLMYDARFQLDAYDVLRADEIVAGVEALG